jgi:anti-sigma factor RsiW
MTPTVPAHPHAHVLATLALGEVDAGTRQRLAAHLAGCPACRAEVASIEETLATLANWPDEAPPTDGFERVLARLAASPERPRGATSSHGWLAATLRCLAGVSAGASLIYLLGTHLATLPLWTRLTVAAPLRTFGGIGLAALVFFVVGSFFTLALTPVLLLERSEAEGRRRALVMIGPRA